MAKKDFLLLLDELFEQEPGTLKGPERLGEEVEWDSTAMMMMIALVDEHCNLALSPRQFVNCTTVDDLAGLAGFRSATA